MCVHWRAMIACPTTKNTWTASYAKHEQDEDVGVSFKLFNSTMFSEDAEIIACRSREGCPGCRAKVTWPTQNFIVATSSSLRAQYNILPRPLNSGPPQKLMTECCLTTTVFPLSLIILACRVHLNMSANFALHKATASWIISDFQPGRSRLDDAQTEKQQFNSVARNPKAVSASC